MDKELSSVKVNPDVLNLLLDYCRFHRAPGRSDKVNNAHPATDISDTLLQCGITSGGYGMSFLTTLMQERKLFDEKFIRLDTRRLCELTSAADALDMKPLVDLTSRALARMIEGKSADEIRCALQLL